ncbi:MAG: hypothetical protein MZV64_13055 [Ignavibacteriales bacterium]|nr:hypothetical protein [Ignavibacteriales bacterium]
MPPDVLLVPPSFAGVFEKDHADGADLGLRASSHGSVPFEPEISAVDRGNIIFPGDDSKAVPAGGQGITQDRPRAPRRRPRPIRRGPARALRPDHQDGRRPGPFLGRSVLNLTE